MAGAVPPDRGYLVDYGEIKAAVAPVIDQLDHYCLNDIPGLEVPTAENLAAWLWQRLRPALPQLAAIVVNETCTSSCTYTGE